MSKARDFLEVVRKINNKDYKFWVVVNSKIYSGWEYKEDAIDGVNDIKDMNLVRSMPRIYQRVGLKKLGLNPDDNNDWMGNITKD